MGQTKFDHTLISTATLSMSACFSPRRHTHKVYRSGPTVYYTDYPIPQNAEVLRIASQERVLYGIVLYR